MASEVSVSKFESTNETYHDGFLTNSMLNKMPMNRSETESIDYSKVLHDLSRDCCVKLQRCPQLDILLATKRWTIRLEDELMKICEETTATLPQNNNKTKRRRKNGSLITDQYTNRINNISHWESKKRDWQKLNDEISFCYINKKKKLNNEFKCDYSKNSKIVHQNDSKYLNLDANCNTVQLPKQNVFGISDTSTSTADSKELINNILINLSNYYFWADKFKSNISNSSGELSKSSSSEGVNLNIGQNASYNKTIINKIESNVDKTIITKKVYHRKNSNNNNLEPLFQDKQTFSSKCDKNKNIPPFDNNFTSIEYPVVNSKINIPKPKIYLAGNPEKLKSNYCQNIAQNYSFNNCFTAFEDRLMNRQAYPNLSENHPLTSYQANSTGLSNNAMPNLNRNINQLNKDFYSNNYTPLDQQVNLNQINCSNRLENIPSMNPIDLSVMPNNIVPNNNQNVSPINNYNFSNNLTSADQQRINFNLQNDFNMYKNLVQNSKRFNFYDFNHDLLSNYHMNMMQTDLLHGLNSCSFNQQINCHQLIKSNILNNLPLTCNQPCKPISNQNIKSTSQNTNLATAESTVLSIEPEFNSGQTNLSTGIQNLNYNSYTNVARTSTDRIYDRFNHINRQTNSDFKNYSDPLQLHQPNSTRSVHNMTANTYNSGLNTKQAPANKIGCVQYKKFSMPQKSSSAEQKRTNSSQNVLSKSESNSPIRNNGSSSFVNYDRDRAITKSQVNSELVSNVSSQQSQINSKNGSVNLKHLDSKLIHSNRDENLMHNNNNLISLAVDYMIMDAEDLNDKNNSIEPSIGQNKSFAGKSNRPDNHCDNISASFNHIPSIFHDNSNNIKESPEIPFKSNYPMYKIQPDIKSCDVIKENTSFKMNIKDLEMFSDTYMKTNNAVDENICRKIAAKPYPKKDKNEDTAQNLSEKQIINEEMLNRKAGQLFSFKCNSGICNNMAEVVCGACHLFVYCSKECQLYHWYSDHEKKCTLEFQSDS